MYVKISRMTTSVYPNNDYSNRYHTIANFNMVATKRNKKKQKATLLIDINSILSHDLKQFIVSKITYGAII